LKEKSDLFDLKNLVLIKEIDYRKKKLQYDILYEVPIRNSDERLYFLLEHKSRRANDFTIQMMKYKLIIHKWQKIEFGRMHSIIPILFYQGLEKWDPEGDLNEIKALNNPILSGQRDEFLIFNLQKIDPVSDFVRPELRAGLLILKIIRYRWEEFIEGWDKIRGILNSMEEAKRIDLEEEMLDYIFRSRTEENDFLEGAIMGKKVLTAYERALEEGREEGELRGELKKALETAQKMKDEGFNPEQIIRITGLSEDQLKENGIL